MKSFIPYGRHNIEDEDKSAILAILESEWLTQGPTIERFEKALCDKTGSKYAVVLSSGTAALHAAYAALGVECGDIVVTSPISFVATTNGAVYLGAECQFADIEPDTALMDPEILQLSLESISPKVITPVHFAGQPSEMEKVKILADTRGAYVLEDAAHALGATWIDTSGQEHKVGDCSHSDISVFSFHPVKHVAAGEGGAVMTNNSGIADFVRRFRTHGITNDPDQMSHNPGPWYYEMIDAGFNYRITDIQCALGISQLSRLEKNIIRRRDIAQQYDAAFFSSDLLSPLKEHAGRQSAYHLYVVRLNLDLLNCDRGAILVELRESGIGAHVHYIPIYYHPYYQHVLELNTVMCPNAESYYSSALTLPLFPTLSEDEIQCVIETMLRILESHYIS